ncbi:PH domain-containing protein [Halosegnis marinus]|uniref:PH domain-containing protein n=1 Tax=Halosegnis marinus TaxID=3034023 RepID=UPI00361325D6
MKLHPLSVPYRTGSAVARFAWVLVIGTVSTSQLDGFGALAAGALVVALLGVLAYQVAYVRRFDYELTDDTFDLASGVVSRRTREIPYRRVQNVDVSRNVVQRALGLAEVRIETAGGGETEAQLRYVSHDEAERLQREIGRRKRGDGETATDPDGTAPPVEDAGERLFAVTNRELLLLGVVQVDLRLLSFVTVLLPVVLPR